MTEPNAPRQDAHRRGNRTRSDYQDFHESLAAPVPNRTYRSQVDLIDTQPSLFEQVIRLIGGILIVLLAGRLITGLFTSDPNNPVVAFFWNATNWLVWPFQALLGQPEINATRGFFDWPAVAAIVAVSVIAALLVRLVRQPRV
jgi:hypothetical protein